MFPGLFEMTGAAVEFAESCVEQVVVSDRRVFAYLGQFVNAREWSGDLGDDDRPIERGKPANDGS